MLFRYFRDEIAYTGGGLFLRRSLYVHFEKFVTEDVVVVLV